MILTADSEHIYSRCPSLQKPENNILLLLTWSSIVHGRPLEVLSEWASSGESLKLSQRLMGDLQNPQGAEQLALTLVALLCHERLLPYTSNDTTRPINGCYLADLHVLFNSKSLSNQRAVFERMGFSFLRVLPTFGDDYADMIQLLAGVLDKDAPLLELFDGFTDRYVAGRTKHRLSHISAVEEVGILPLMETLSELSMGDGSSSQRIDNTLEDYCMVGRPGNGGEDASQRDDHQGLWA